MKNSNTKTKLVARVMLLIFLLASAVTLTACPGNSRHEQYSFIYSYDEMLEYVNMHKELFPSDDCIFWMFNLDEYENIRLNYYFVEMVWYAEGLEYYLPYKEEKISSNHFNTDNACEYTMNMVLNNEHIIENAYTIKCYNAYWSEDDVLNNPSGIKRNKINDSDSMSDNGYTSEYSLFLKNNMGVKFYIFHEHEATQEELDAIVTIFKENVIIIE